MSDNFDLLRSDPALAKALDNLQNPSQATTVDGSRTLGWADSIGEGQSAKDLLNRGDVLADLRAFYKERDGFEPADDDELRDKFWSDRTWRNMNTVSMAKDVKDAYGMSDEQATRLAKIQKLHDSLPNFYESGGRGLSGFAQNAGAAIIDPVNLIGGIFGKAAGGTAMRGAARAALKEAGARGAERVLTKEMRGQIVRRGLIAGAKAGAKAEAIESGITGMGQDALMQARNTEIGLQDGYSLTQGLGAGVTNAAMGGVMGGIFGAGGAAYGGKISRAVGKAKTKTFGDFTNKYTSADAIVSPEGVANTVDAEAVGTPATPADKSDAKVEKYVAAQREQYQRNLDATIDRIRSESGEKSLAEWRTGVVKDAEKTEAMKQADAMQSGRTALEDLYNWPTKRAAHERQLEQLSSLETLKPDQVTRINELNDILARGDDAYESIVRAAGDGKEVDFDKAIDSFANATKKATQAEEPAVNPAQQPQAPQPVIKKDETNSLVAGIEDSNIVNADEAALAQELTTVAAAKQQGVTIPTGYETKLQTRYKELTGNDFVVKAPDVNDTDVVDTSQATALPEVSTAEEAADAIASMGKQYNALTNQIARINKAIKNGKAKPEHHERLKEITAQRETLNVQRKQLEERAAALTEQETSAPTQPVIRTVEAEAADAPLDIDGVSSFLSSYGFPAHNIKKEMASYLKAKAPASRDGRAQIVRQYVGEKIAYARSLSHLEQVLDKMGTPVAYLPEVMKKLLETDTSIPVNMRDATIARYNEWLDFNAPALLTKYIADNPDLQLNDVLGLIAQNHGDDMERIIMQQLGGPDAEDVIQHMAFKKGMPTGWDKLTTAQQNAITQKIDAIRARLTGPGATAISPKKLEGLLELQKRQLTLKQLEDDFGAAVRTSGKSLGDNYPVIVDPETKGTVSGKVWNYAGDGTATTGTDKYGLQAMLRKATGGRASSVDEFGDLVIENPYFGSLLVRSIERNPDGTINYAKTAEGKRYARKFDAAESAHRANEEAMIKRASDRRAKVTEDVGPLKAGDSATAKELAAAQVEAARLNPNRKTLNKKATGPDKDEAAEALSKELRESVKKSVVTDAVRNAMDTSPAAPERALQENITAVEAELKEPVTLTESEAAWATVESERRTESVEAVRQRRINEAVENFRIHNDAATLAEDLKRINAELSSTAVKPKAHADKPAGAKVEPRMYVYKGWEVDVRNHFSYKKTSDSTTAISFMGEKVGDLKTNSDGSATLLFTDTAGLESSVKASSLDKMAEHLPRIFGTKVEQAGAAGNLVKSFDESTDSVYPIDWKASNTWGKQSRTVPVETPVEEPAKLIGPVTNFKANPDVSAINVDIPEGHVLAVHILEGDFKGVTRVESTKSKNPQTVGQILGAQKGKAYTVGYVPAGTSSASRDATRLFQPLDAQDPIYRAGAPEAGSATGKSPAIQPNELGQIKLDGLSKVAIDQNDLPIQFRDKGLTTLAKVHNLITSLENVRWADIRTAEQYATFTQDIADLYEVRTKYAPKGIELPSASRVQAMNQWHKAMSNYDGTTIATGIDILRRLSSNDRNLPIISGKEMGENAGGYALPTAGADDANRIFLNPAAFDPDGKGAQVPQPVALLHEVAHWAYMNILGDADRMQFWGSLQKYFDSGSVDLNQIRSRLPGVGGDAEAISPAEFFANQFTQWAVTEGKMNNIPLWSKMARVIVQIAQAFGVNIKGERAFADPDLVDIDPDFVELFAKILPDNDKMHDRYVGLYKTLEDIRQLKNDAHAKTASLAAKQLVDFDDMRRKLDSAIDTQNPMDLELALDEVARDIYSKFGGKFPKVRLMKGGNAATAKARRELLSAHAKWKELQKAMTSESGSPRELSTADLGESESGDLGSSFEAITDVAFSTLDNDLTSSLSLMANNFINAIASSQDEMRSIIGRTGQLEGKTIRVFKDGSFESVDPNNFGVVQRKRAAKRAFAKTIAAAKEIDEVTQQIESGIVHASDRDHLPQPSMVEATNYAPVSAMSTEELAREDKSLAGQRSVRKKELEVEIKGRTASMPEVEYTVPDAKYQDTPIKTLEKDLLSSIKRGQWDEMKAIANAIGWKKRANLEEGILTANSPKVRKAVKILQAANTSAAMDNGVPANAPLQVRDTIKNITHRTRADESASRITATRLIALMGRGLDAASNDGFVTRNDISRLLGQGDIGDDAPIAETDALFSQFREEMREVGKQVRTPAGQIAAAQKLSRMAINALVAPEELARLGTNAEEMAAAFISVSRGKGSLDAIFDSLPESARVRVADIYKENVQALGLVMRGMLSGDARKELQPLTFYGDMLREPAERRPYRTAANATGLRGVHPALAEGLRKEIISTTPDLRRTTLENFTGKPLEKSIAFYDGNGSVPFELLESKGKLSAPVEDGDFGTGVYLKKSAADAEDFPNENIKWASRTIQELRDRIGREQANLEAIRDAGGDAADYNASVLQPLLRRITTATTTEANLWRELRATEKVKGQAKVIPFVSRAKNSFDFSNSTEYTFGTESSSSLDWLLTGLENSGLISGKSADELRSSPITLTGKDAYAQLRRAVAKNADSGDVEAANLLNDGLKEMGFDSIDFGDGTVVFDKDAVRHIDDGAFALDDQVHNFTEGQYTSVAGQYLEALMAGSVDTKNATPLVAELQNMGFPAAMADPIKRVFQKKSITTADIDNVNTMTRVLGESSVRIRKSGAHWLADKIKPLGGAGFYEKLDTMTSKALLVSRDAKGRPISVLTKARQLPGTPSVAKRWADRSKFWGKVPQPAVYDAIVMAMRMGDDAINKLPTEARAVARDLQKFFREQFVAARADGLPIGYKANYLPQVYNTDAIKTDPTGFENLLTQFFLREMKQGRVPMAAGKDPTLVAKAKAAKLRRTLTSEGSDGVLLPDSGLRQSMESPFFERVMNYSPDEIPGINKYLVNDLEGIITRYADQVSRRRVLTREFGLGNHAVSTYLNVLQNGKDAIVDALRNTKTMSIERRAADATMDTRVAETSEIVRGIPGTAEEVGELVDTALELLGTTKDQWQSNKEKVRNYLLNLQDPAIVASQPEYAKRVDAIVNALAEFGGNADAVPRHELKAMVDSVNAAAKRARDVSPQLLKASRAIRGFQQITLLPFTTLTSIPDIGLPAVRSGNMKAAVAGWKKFLNDPHYREMGRNIALGVQGIMHERMAHMYNDTSGRLSNAFFNLNFLTPWTDTMRPVASLIGLESFRAEAKRAQDLLARGMTDSAGYRKSLRYLTRYGLESYALPGARAISEDSVDIANDDALREAMLRFANEAIFAPNPNDVPLWAQHPVGQIVFQLKSYPLMMGRMAKYVLDEAFGKEVDGKWKANPAPFFMLIASSGALGSLSLAVKDVVQGRGEDGNTFRERYGSEAPMVGAFIRWYNDVAKHLGLDIEQHGTADAVAGWFAESFMSAGGMGLFADLLHSSVEQADNQDYGKIRTAGAIFGPSVSTAMDGIGIAQAGLGQVFSEDPDTRTTRAAVRSVAGRIPFVGGIKPVREAITDAIAGESEGGSSGGSGSKKRVKII